MKTGMHGGVAMEQPVHVAALAEIVQDLIGGGARLQDGCWLRQRVRAAGLDRHEGAALEALRVRLWEGRTALLDAAATSLGPW